MQTNQHTKWILYVPFLWHLSLHWEGNDSFLLKCDLIWLMCPEVSEFIKATADNVYSSAPVSPCIVKYLCALQDVVITVFCFDVAATNFSAAYLRCWWITKVLGTHPLLWSFVLLLHFTLNSVEWRMCLRHPVDRLEVFCWRKSFSGYWPQCHSCPLSHITQRSKVQNQFCRFPSMEPPRQWNCFEWCRITSTPLKASSSECSSTLLQAEGWVAWSLGESLCWSWNVPYMQ